MDSWERFDETVLPNKEVCYSNLNIEDITDAHDRYAKNIYKEFNNENLGDYYDLHVQIDTLLLCRCI